MTSPVEEGVAAATVEERRGRRWEMVGSQGRLARLEEGHTSATGRRLRSEL